MFRFFVRIVPFCPHFGFVSQSITLFLLTTKLHWTWWTKETVRHSFFLIFQFCYHNMFSLYVKFLQTVEWSFLRNYIIFIYVFFHYSFFILTDAVTFLILFSWFVEEEIYWNLEVLKSLFAIITGFWVKNRKYSVKMDLTTV